MAGSSQAGSTGSGCTASPGSASHPSSATAAAACFSRCRLVLPGGLHLRGTPLHRHADLDAVGDRGKDRPAVRAGQAPGRDGIAAGRTGARLGDHDYLVPAPIRRGVKAAGCLRALPLPRRAMSQCPERPPCADQLHGPRRAPPRGREAGDKEARRPDGDERQHRQEQDRRVRPGSAAASSVRR